MNDELKIEEFINLLEKIYNLCDIMPKKVFEYFDNKRYLYSLFFDAFNSIKGFCKLLKEDCLVSQACVVLRMAIEKTATIRVIVANDNLYEKYCFHQKLRLQIINMNNSEKRKKIKECFKDEIIADPISFLEYGWFKSLSNEYNFDSLIKLSKIQESDDAINEWKNELNQWVHGNIESMCLFCKKNDGIIYAHNLILVSAKLLDNLIVDFHNDSGFNFKLDGCDYLKEFRDAWAHAVGE